MPIELADSVPKSTNDLVMKHFNDGCILGSICLRSTNKARNNKIIGENQQMIREEAKKVFGDGGF
jgi:hypothetical protein